MNETELTYAALFVFIVMPIFGILPYAFFELLQRAVFILIVGVGGTLVEIIEWFARKVFG